MSEVSPVVFLVDDDNAVRTSLARLIKSAGYRVEPYDSARAFMDRRAESTGRACLVLDVQMPDLTGLELQRALNVAESALPIVFLTGHGDIPMSVRAIQAGAADFLTKPVEDTQLLGAIERAIARSERDSADKEERDAIRGCMRSLTPREHQVMDQVVAGRLNKQIAADLGTAHKTIKVHRARVMEKMRAKSLAALVRMVEKTKSRP